MTADDDPRGRVRQLILSGDNLQKTRSDDVAAARVRERFSDALKLARDHGFDDLVDIIQLRLTDLDRGGPDDV